MIPASESLVALVSVYGRERRAEARPPADPQYLDRSFIAGHRVSFNQVGSSSRAASQSAGIPSVPV